MNGGTATLRQLRDRLAEALDPRNEWSRKWAAPERENSRLRTALERNVMDDGKKWYEVIVSREWSQTLMVRAKDREEAWEVADDALVRGLVDPVRAEDSVYHGDSDVVDVDGRPRYGQTVLERTDDGGLAVSVSENKDNI